MDDKQMQQHFGRNYHQHLLAQQQNYTQMQGYGNDIGQFEQALLAEQYMLDAESPLDSDDPLSYHPANYHHLMDRQQYYQHPSAQYVSNECLIMILIF